MDFSVLLSSESKNDCGVSEDRSVETVVNFDHIILPMLHVTHYDALEDKITKNVVICNEVGVDYYV